MSKAFTKEQDEEELEPVQASVTTGSKNYITPGGYQRLKNELLQLLDKERPEMVKVIAWAAANGDRSENADYIYGKRRLREIDKRIRFLTKRLDQAVVVDPAERGDIEQIFFGATVRLRDNLGKIVTYSIVGTDEIDTEKGWISWMSPLAKALIKAYVGDTINFKTPNGNKEYEILSVRYQKLE